MRSHLSGRMTNFNLPWRRWWSGTTLWLRLRSFFFCFWQGWLCGSLSRCLCEPPKDQSMPDTSEVTKVSSCAVSAMPRKTLATDAAVRREFAFCETLKFLHAKTSDNSPEVCRESSNPNATHRVSWGVALWIRWALGKPTPLPAAATELPGRSMGRPGNAKSMPLSPTSSNTNNVVASRLLAGPKPQSPRCHDELSAHLLSAELGPDQSALKMRSCDGCDSHLWHQAYLTDLFIKIRDSVGKIMRKT